ncbi:MAG TPA: alpha/beta hydrolase-fold protein [Actinomycetota bacterium]|nr:alpha/beta hydrolase-fold protein [Actinomycetota bacterium]
MLRRLLVVIVALGVTACVGTGDLASPDERAQATSERDDPHRLTARPSAKVARDAPTGILPLVPGSPGDGWLVVPERYASQRPARLVLSLRGAGGTARAALRFFRDDVDRRNLILVAPEARGRTWDLALGDPGADAVFIDRSLARVFSRYAVDPRQVAVAGYSDGASFALTLGLTNGDLFRHVIALSPGFMDVRTAIGSPRVFVSHGTSDDTLPIERTSEPLVERMRDAGYDVRFVRFEAEHTVPETVRAHALRWFLRGGGR